MPPDDDDGDEALVSRAVALGDTTAFEALVRRHQYRVRRWLVQLCGNAAEADDLAQEAFIKAWSRLRSYSGRGRFAGWLMTIAYNEFLQGRRKQARDLRLATIVHADAQSRSTAGPDAGTLVDLPRFLRVLSDAERAAMVLSYAHGFSHTEIAALMELPIGTVKSHIRRGRAKIEASFSLEGCV